MASRRDEIREADVLGALEEARYPLSVRELASQLEAHGEERHSLKKMLRRLVQSGRVAEVQGGRYFPAHWVPRKVTTATG
ncbi:MAG: hypothetical protein HYY26_03160 [Acidobacteria bacterium]|nr:hypothetical protein [Acidobacteriota bacterium]